MKFLLDTTFCVRALRRKKRVFDRLVAQLRSNLAVSRVPRLSRSAAPPPRRRGGSLEIFVRPLRMLELIADDAAAHARVGEKLRRAQRLARPLDVLIVAQVVARKLALVSTNEFGRIPDLRVYNWALREQRARRGAGCSPRMASGFTESVTNP